MSDLLVQVDPIVIPFKQNVVRAIRIGIIVTEVVADEIDEIVGDVNWGDIGGTLTNQADLQAALDLKLEDAPSDGDEYVRKDGVWEIASGGGGGGGVSVHANLTGLADDDHSQYHNDVRGDARYYKQVDVDSALSGKSDIGHSHVISDTTGLQSALDGKSATGHSHAMPTENIIYTGTKTAGQNINGVEGTESDLTWNQVSIDGSEMSLVNGTAKAIFTNAGWVNIHASAYIADGLMNNRTMISISLYHYDVGDSLKYSYHGDMQYNRDDAAAYDSSGGSVNQNMMYVEANDYIIIRTRIFDDGTSGTIQTFDSVYSKLRIAQIVF